MLMLDSDIQMFTVIVPEIVTSAASGSEIHSTVLPALASQMSPMPLAGSGLLW
jgi:hypothetical protein